MPPAIFAASTLRHHLGSLGDAVKHGSRFFFYRSDVAEGKRDGAVCQTLVKWGRRCCRVGRWHSLCCTSWCAHVPRPDLTSSAQECVSSCGGRVTLNCEATSHSPFLSGCTGPTCRRTVRIASFRLIVCWKWRLVRRQCRQHASVPDWDR